MITHFKTILLIGAMLCPALLCAQSEIDHPKYAEGREAVKRGKVNQAITIYRSFLEGTDTLSSSQKGELYFDLGAAYFSTTFSDSTIKYLQISLDEKEKTLSVTDTSLLRTHAVLGYVHRYEKTQVRQALKHYEAERAIIEANAQYIKDERKFYNLYNLATSHRFIANYDRALNYVYRALDLESTRKGGDPENLANCYSAIANILTGKRKYSEATAYYIKKIELTIDAFGAGHKNLATDYYNLASNYLDLRVAEKALDPLEKALRLVEKQKRITVSDVYALYGNAMTLLGRYPEARSYLKQAVEAAEGTRLLQASAYRRYARYHEALNQYDSAINCYQKAFQSLFPGFQPETLSSNPGLEYLKTDALSFSILSNKADCWYSKYLNTGEISALEISNRTFELLDDVTDHHRNNYVLESSRLFFQEVNHIRYQNAMEVVYQLYQNQGDAKLLESAWQIMEKNKSLLMLEDLTAAENLTGLDLPDSLVEERNVLSKALIRAQKNLLDCELSENCSDSTSIGLRETISMNEEKLLKHRRLLEKEFSNYYNFTSDQQIIKFSEAISQLDESRAIIGYFSSKDHYYFLASDGRRSDFGRVKKDSLFNENVLRFISEISGETLASNSIKVSFENFTTSSRYLYQTLIPEWINPKQHKEIIVIPDGDLSSVPFEALLTSTSSEGISNFAGLPYAIREHEFHYGFSATLWFKNHQLSDSRNVNKFLAFGAANITNRPELARLSATQSEINTLMDIKGSEVYRNQEATEKNFKDHVNDADIVHLALHNINDYDNPLNSQLVFNEDNPEDGNLHLYEIFNTIMNPSLVVLSGCETGIGKWQRGEGAYHIGRGFVYHGNPAMIISLWKVGDAATSGIMSDFYEAFNDRSSSTQAMRSAKLAYLERADEITAHPANWAAFVSIGDVKRTSESLSIVTYLGISILILSILVLIAKKSRHAKA